MKVFVLTSLFSLLTAFFHAQMHSIDHVFISKVFGKERKISVYLPQQEEVVDPDQRYAVMYVFDGQFEPYTEMVRSITDYYALSGEGIPVIVVGIHTEERWDEFVPQIENEELVPNQAAELLSTSLRNEIFPLVDSLYKTKPFRIGVGHSLGGTYVFHEIVKENALFQAVVAISPNLGMNNEYLVLKGKELLDKPASALKFLYMTVGTVANPEVLFKLNVDELKQSITENSSNNVLFYCSVLEGENHMTTFVPSFNKAYLMLSSKMMLTDLSLRALFQDTAVSVMNTLSAYLDVKERLTGEKQSRDIHFYATVGRSFLDAEAYETCLQLSAYTLGLLDEKKELTKEEKQLRDKMEGRIAWCTFKKLAKQAEQKFTGKEYEASANLYKEAFKIKDKRGTHMERIRAVLVFGEMGDLDAAFEQLELLANYFELQGNRYFIDNAHCEKLKNDPRWKKIMDKLEKNRIKAN